MSRQGGINGFAKPREVRYAEELRKLYRTIKKEGLELNSGEDILSRLITLCNSIRCTDSLKEHIRDLLMTGTVTGFPVEIFNLPTAREFERLQILIYQRMAIRMALKFGEKDRAKFLYRRLQRWKEQFEKLYEEPVTRECNKKEVARHVKHLCQVEEQQE